MTLESKQCLPCKGGVEPLSRSDAQQFSQHAPMWQLSEDTHHIEREYKFKNFVEALAFVNRLGELAEEQGHHPDITFGWAYVRVVFYTHKIKGLHENDFIMAAKTDRIFDPE